MPNRLARERSPYLKAHADDPVDWWPWGPEAFRKARREDKPVFLSIGYSTCHWCHVMARESFRDPEVARRLNEGFVPVKVDREERPDVDAVYMTACQLLTGQGGWPLTLLLTPDGKPFFAATYLPKEGRFGRLGLTELLERVRALWRDPEQRRALLEQAERVWQAVERAEAPTPLAPAVTVVSGVSGLSDREGGAKGGEKLLRRAYEAFVQSFDREHGGFGRAPKFPIPHQLRLLLRLGKRFEEPFALEMVERTLQAIRQGGIYDHVGFGVHRYATDRAWRLPHFEKMLYDQALLALACLEAYQVTGRPLYARTAREIFEYVLRDLTSPEGGFYSAEDAESEGEEGKFYTWRYDELEALLEPEELRLVERAFGVRPEGNYAEEATGRLTGRNVLAQMAPWGDVARELGLPDEAAALALWERARRKLVEARQRRPRPARDTKVLTDWNGLMIAALAVGARALDEPRYAEAAARAARFVEERLVVEGRLLHRYGDGEAAVPAFLDDHAFLAWGLFELHQTTFELSHLERAVRLVEAALQRFWDPEAGGFFFTAPEHHASREAPELPRRRALHDGAVPSGTAVMAELLLKLGRLLGRPEWEGRAEGALRWAAPWAERAPTAHAHLLIALDLALGPTAELVLVGRRDDPQLRELMRAAFAGFHPRLSALLKPEDDPAAADTLGALAPATRALRPAPGRATAYLCERFACGPPLTTPEALRARLRAL